MFANQVQKYIKETLDGNLSGDEVIQIKQEIISQIEHIKVESKNLLNYLRFNETDLSSFDNDLSAIKSLSI